MLQNSQCTLYGTGSAVSTSGTQLTMTVRVSFTAAFAGTKGLYLWACDSAGDTSGQLEMGNWTVTAPPAPDMTIAERHSPTIFAQLQSATYTITASNRGTAATNGVVTVTDPLPAGLTASSMTGSGWNCTLSTVTCTRSDVLALGSSYPAVTLTVNVAGNAPPVVTDTAHVSGGGEINTGNDSFDDVAGVGQSTLATLIDPSPGSTLSDVEIVFQWNPGATGTQYYLYVGTTGAGSNNIFPPPRPAASPRT